MQVDQCYLGYQVWLLSSSISYHIFLKKLVAGQRVVARLREQTYSRALKQEVEFVEKGEGDVLSRLSVDTSIVGERCVNYLLHLGKIESCFLVYLVSLKICPTVFAQLLCPQLAVSFSNGSYYQNPFKLILTSCLSGRHVLCLAHSNDVDAGGCSSSLFGCGTWLRLRLCPCLQVLLAGLLWTLPQEDLQPHAGSCR